MKRTGRLPYRSRKTTAAYRKRVVLVRWLLEEHPVCQRCGMQESTEVHELKSRARGGSILDVENTCALCHFCHSWVTEHPAAALTEGWLLNSWDVA